MAWRAALATFACVSWCAAAAPAAAEIRDAHLTEIAEAYERSLPAASGEPVTDIVISLGDARRAGRGADILRLSEALVASDRDNIQSWLALARAWLATDGAASNGLAAAIRATQAADTSGDRAEALLLASAFLRNRLALARARHDDARTAIAAAEAAMVQARDLGRQQDFAAPDPETEGGRISALHATVSDATTLVAAAAAEIAQIATALDEVYRELQANLPGLDETALRGSDSRLAFDLVRDEDQYGNSTVRSTIHVEGNDVRACLTFSTRLKDDDLSYRDFVTVRDASGDPVLDYDVHGRGEELCILRLTPGENYEATVSTGLASADGRHLEADQTVTIVIPDLPARVGFGDAEFILPRNGPGELPVYLTNVEAEIPLFVHRISDRTLYRHLALGHIRNGIPNREHRDLIDRFSDTLWRGHAARPLAEDEHNRTVRSFVPVRSILEDRADWIADIGWNDRQGGKGSESDERLVRNLSDDRLSIKGRFIDDGFSAGDTAKSGLLPGVHVLVAGVREPGGAPAHQLYCEGDENCQVFTTQWFVITDIGLTFYEGEQDFTVVARSLDTGGPVAGARIELVAQGNKVLAELLTDGNGVARFDRALTGGRGSNQLVAVLAHKDDDFSFIKYGSERLDLSRLNVGGHAGEEALGAALYTDRGIYQPGETVQALALMRDRTAAGMINAELRLRIGDQVVSTQPLAPSSWAEGGTLAALMVPQAARPGSATLALVSPSGTELASTQIDIGRIRPDRARLRFDTDSLTMRVGAGGVAEISGRASAQYLYGAEGSGQAPASGLKAELSVRIQPARSPLAGCYDGFGFGAFDEAVLPVVSRNFVDFTDEEGVLGFTLAGVRLPETTRPLSAVVELTLFDAAGPLAGGQTEIAVPVRQMALGVSSTPRLVVRDGGYSLGLDVAAIGPDGQPAAGRDVQVTLEREQEFYAWENVDGTWQHIRTRQRSPVSGMTARLAGTGSAGGPCPPAAALADVATGIPDGRYVVTVTEPESGATASVRFNTGVTQTAADDLEPNIFVLSAGKERYAPRERVELTIEAPFDRGEALVAVAGRDIQAWYTAEVRGGRGTVSFVADATLAGKGWYALATVFKADTASESHLGPARAIGAAYFEVSDDRQAFEIAILRQQSGLDDFLRPHEALRFDVCLSDGRGGCATDRDDAVHAVAFVVDEGLVSLTGHEARADQLERSFVGREALKLRLMDNYGRLLLREGGDLPGRLALSNYTSNRIVATAQGPVALRGGRASFSFDDPGLNAGSLKIYVVAWSAGHVASARDTVPVRQFLVSNLGLPEFLMAGDSPQFPLRLENISFAGHDGDYALSLTAAGGIGVNLLRADGGRVEADANGRFMVPVPPGQPQDLLLALDLPPKLAGSHELKMEISAAGAAVDLPREERLRTWTLDVRRSGVEVQRQLSFPLGERPVDLAGLLASELAAYDADSVRITANFSSDESLLRLASFDAGMPDGEAVLDRMVWDGFVQLQDPRLAQDERFRADVQRNIDNVLALQLPDGAFVPYRTNGEFVAGELGFDTTASRSLVRHGLLRTTAAVDFITRARRAGYVVPSGAMNNALAYIGARVGDAQSYFTSYMEPELLCSFETRYAMLLLIDAGKFDRQQLDNLEACSDDAYPSAGSVFSELVSHAVQVRYGEMGDARAILASHYDAPDDYLADLDPYRKAIAISMLADAGADPGLVRSIARSYLDGGRQPPDLRTRAWLARAVADIGGQSADLAVGDLVVARPELFDLKTRPDGIIESRAFTPAELDRGGSTIGLAQPAQGRGYLRISGLLQDAGNLALPDTIFRRRFFRPGTGAEFDPRESPPEVGDAVVIVIEAAAGMLKQFLDDDLSDVGMTYGPVLVDVAMPSALAIVSERLPTPPADSDLARLPLYGNLRSVSSHPQHWRGVVVPESTRSRAERPGRDEAEPEPAGQAPYEFRQGFVARVTAAGTFEFPPSVVDALDFPGTTLVSEPLAFSTAVPRRRAQ